MTRKGRKREVHLPTVCILTYESAIYALQYKRGFLLYAHTMTFHFYTVFS